MTDPTTTRAGRHAPTTPLDRPDHPDLGDLRGRAELPGPDEGTDRRADGSSWTVADEPVHSPAAAMLLREYFVEVADRWYRLHRGRGATAEEIEQGLAEHHSDDLVPPHGVLLVGRYGGEPAGCVGLRRRDGATAELTRMFVRPARRGTGGGAELLRAADLAARAMGARRITLDTRLDLVEARALYARHGYAEIAPYKEDPYAECFYGKELV